MKFLDFSELYFLYGLLPLVVLAYYLLPQIGYRNILLIGVSLLLYAMCQPVYVPLLLILCRMNYKFALKIRKGHKGTIVFPVLVNLFVLILFKYVDPVLMLAGIGTQSGGLLVGLTGKIVEYLNRYGMSLCVPASIAPLGLSLFTLNVISYLADIYRGKHSAERSYTHFLLHMLFFVKLFQGPLVRYEQTAAQLRDRRENFRAVFEGVVRFCTGLGKKVLLADYCGRMIAELAEKSSNQALVGSWLSAVLFLFRVYYDFSGCCDMAIGLGRIFGFRLPENFNLPYTALSVTDFVKRWNVTLVSFFRDYIYTPLCGKRAGNLNQCIAMMLSFILAGIWHGGTFNFLILGVYLFIAVLAEKYLEDSLVDLPDWLRRILTMLVILFGWVIFMHPDVESLSSALKAMIGDGGFNVRGDGNRVMNCLPLIGACWFGVTSMPRQLRYRWRNVCGMIATKEKKEPSITMTYVYIGSCVVYVCLILWWCTVSRCGTPALPSIFLGL